jgi:hypothetical protein
MPEGDSHRCLVELVRTFPAVVEDLLEHALGEQAPPRASRVKADSEELSILQSQKLNADNVVVFEDAQGRPLLGVVLEVQQKPEDERLFRWPLYSYQMRDRLNPRHDPLNECPVKLMVFAVDEKTASWAGKPIAARGGKISFTPDVIGPRNLPEITDIEAARHHPAMAALCAAAHPQSLQAARTALAAIEALPAHNRDILFEVLVNPVRNIEDLRQMSAAFDEFTSDFARRFLEEGMAKGFEQGIEKGIERGIEQGIEKGKREMLLAIALEQLRKRFPEQMDDAAAKAATDAPTEQLEKVIVNGDLLRATELSEALGRLQGSPAQHPPSVGLEDLSKAPAADDDPPSRGP